MSTLLHETLEALGADSLPRCTSRALRLTRYARPELNDKTQPTRHDFLKAVISPKEQRTDVALKSWHAWLNSIGRPTDLIHAKLEARLLINMGGTVLENAGLQIDRFGTAFIPGSAVKACARRTALAALRQWNETGAKPDASKDDALAPACEAFANPGDLLVAILRVFGCTDLEWIGYDPSPPAREKNDFAWACGDDLPDERNCWASLRDAARVCLNSDTATPANDMPSRRGAVAFFPAYPISRPTADLELEVLTSHHPKYYSGDTPTATDTENPIPVFFPAVAAASTYSFALHPVGPTDDKLIAYSRAWLIAGLSIFGIGAKTAAGYGCFTDVTHEIAEKRARETAAIRRQADEEAAKVKQAAEIAARKERETRLAGLAPAAREDFTLAEISADWGRMKQHLSKFGERTHDQQAAILRWFNSSGRDRWLTEIKPGAANGKKPWSQIIGAIHLAKKTHKIDLP